MNLGSASSGYDQREQNELRAALVREDRLNRKVGQDIEISEEMFILRSPNGSRWKLEVSDAGVLSASAL